MPHPVCHDISRWKNYKFLLSRVFKFCLQKKIFWSKLFSTLFLKIFKYVWCITLHVSNYNTIFRGLQELWHRMCQKKTAIICKMIKHVINFMQKFYMNICLIFFCFGDIPCSVFYKIIVDCEYLRLIF